MIHEIQPSIMKRHIATLALMAVVAFGVTASPASAQDRPAEGPRRGDPAQRTERRLERLDEELGLTDAQGRPIARPGTTPIPPQPNIQPSESEKVP